MATTFKREAHRLNYTNSTSSTIDADTVIELTAMIGVAISDIPASAVGAIEIDGVHTLTKNAGEAFTMGQQLYWDATNDELTGTASSHAKAGRAAAAAANAAVVADVILNSNA